MAGLSRPWASRDDAVFWLWMLAMGLGWAGVLVAGALLGWALLLQPALAWCQQGRLGVVTDRATWLHWLGIAAIAEGALGTLLFGFVAWYCDAMLRGSGSAAH
jgi:hypothetical protein